MSQVIAKMGEDHSYALESTPKLAETLVPCGQQERAADLLRHTLHVQAGSTADRIGIKLRGQLADVYLNSSQECEAIDGCQPLIPVADSKVVANGLDGGSGAGCTRTQGRPVKSDPAIDIETVCRSDRPVYFSPPTWAANCRWAHRRYGPDYFCQPA